MTLVTNSLAKLPTNWAEFVLSWFSGMVSQTKIGIHIRINNNLNRDIVCKLPVLQQQDTALKSSKVVETWEWSLEFCRWLDEWLLSNTISHQKSVRPLDMTNKCSPVVTQPPLCCLCIFRLHIVKSGWSFTIRSMYTRHSLGFPIFFALESMRN